MVSSTTPVAAAHAARGGLVSATTASGGGASSAAHVATATATTTSTSSALGGASGGGGGGSGGGRSQPPATTTTTTGGGGGGGAAAAAAAITRVAIRDGKSISINDHIYISAPWAPGGGEPYLIARVMEFVTAPGAGAAASSSSATPPPPPSRPAYSLSLSTPLASVKAPPSTSHAAPQSSTIRVRANLFLRMRDISHRTTNDPRLLVATMHSDVFALENVRGLCEVRHRELVGEAPEVSAWKRREDHFYYHQLYDRYIHRFYDVVPTYKLRNAPPEVLAALRNGYSFVVAEVGMASDLCDALRACSVCHRWAASPESVRCDTCKKFFHMRCLTPPLASKPAKGYSWTCAPCSRRHEQDVGLGALTAGRGGGVGSLQPPPPPPQQQQQQTSASTSAAATATETVARGSGEQGAMREDGAGAAAGGDVGSATGSGSGSGAAAAATPVVGRAGDAPFVPTAGRGRGRGGGRGGSAFAERRAAALHAESVGRGGGSGRGTPDFTPEGSPSTEPRRTLDDVRGTRCCNRWPYRYFGQHTYAPDVLDVHDSIYPRATTRLGPKFQTALVSWDEQRKLGLGVAAERRAAAAANASANAASAGTDEPLGGANADDAATQGAPAPAPAARRGRPPRGGRGKKRDVGAATGSGGATTHAATAAAAAATTSSSSSSSPSHGGVAAAPTAAAALVGGADTTTTTTTTSSSTPNGTPSKPTVNLPVAAAAPPVEADADHFERGGDEGAEAIYLPGICSDQTVDAYLRGTRNHFHAIPPHNVDLVDRALQLLTRHGGNAVAALAELSQSTFEDLRIVHWSARENRAFENAVRDADDNCEMRQLKRLVPTKRPGEIVRHFYAWKVKKLKDLAEKEKQQQANAKGPKAKANPEEERSGIRPNPSSRAVSPSLSVFGDEGTKTSTTATASGAPTTATAAATATSAASSSSTAKSGGGVTSCVMCSTTSSELWYKGPYSWTNRHLCVHCGLYWRKYAAESSHTQELVAVQTKRKEAFADDSSLGVAPPTKAMKLAKGDAAKPATPPPTAPQHLPKPEPLKCVICRRVEPKKKLAQCRQCSLSVHQGCHGLTDDEVKADVWLCEPCTNERTLDAALVPRCMLCPMPLILRYGIGLAGLSSSLTASASSPPSKAASGAPAEKPPEKPPRGRPPKHVAAAAAAAAAAKAKAASQPAAPPLEALDAVKPTECNNWVHLFCAVFMPDIAFADVERMRPVEGVGSLPLWRYRASCTICGQREGACITCAEPSCRSPFHVGCAWRKQPGYTLGFEITPVKSSRRDVVATTSFKSESGHMSALVYCRDCKEVARSKKIYEMSEVDHSTGLTALQTYVQTYKGVGGSASSTSVTTAGASGAATTSPLVTPPGPAPGAAGVSGVGGVGSEQTHALLRRAKRLDAILGGAQGIHGLLGLMTGTGAAHIAGSVPGGTRPARPSLSGPSSSGRASRASVVPASTSTTANGVASLGGGAGAAATAASAFPPSAASPRPWRRRQCVRCGTAYSPFWWDAPPGSAPSPALVSSAAVAPHGRETETTRLGTPVALGDGHSAEPTRGTTPTGEERVTPASQPVRTSTPLQALPPSSDRGAPPAVVVASDTRSAVVCNMCKHALDPSNTRATQPPVTKSAPTPTPAPALAPAPASLSPAQGGATESNGVDARSGGGGDSVEGGVVSERGLEQGGQGGERDGINGSGGLTAQALAPPVRPTSSASSTSLVPATSSSSPFP